MNIVLCGNGPRAVVILDYFIKKKDVKLSACIGHSGKDKGHKGDDFKEKVRNYGIPYYVFDDINSEKAYRKISQISPELIILCSYNQILKEKIINLPIYGAINLHGGRLPHYRGSSVLNWAIINGEDKIGFSIIKVDRKIDAGDILAEKIIDLKKSDTINTVIKKSFEVFPELLGKVIKDIKLKKLKPVKQDEQKAVYYTKRFENDGIINWNTMNDIQVFNLVRALTSPYPGAFTYFKNKKVIVNKTELLKETVKTVPGRICLKRNDGIVTGCKNRSILINEIIIDQKYLNPTDYFKELPENFQQALNSRF